MDRLVIKELSEFIKMMRRLVINFGLIRFRVFLGSCICMCTRRSEQLVGNEAQGIKKRLSRKKVVWQELELVITSLLSVGSVHVHSCCIRRANMSYSATRLTI